MTAADQAADGIDRAWFEPIGFRSQPDHAEVTLSGVALSLGRHISRQGRAYMTGLLRLPDGDVPLLIPPVVYAEVGGLLAEDERLTVTGRVDRRGAVHLLTVTDVH